MQILLEGVDAVQIPDAGLPATQNELWAAFELCVDVALHFIILDCNSHKNAGNYEVSDEFGSPNIIFKLS